ncbi:MAG: sulfatase-like hydrolase/transferase, partial [Draconibacterium sp.]|nr:sulfatase-like hydrolase/transferase [Draconibacterium sp.]
MKNLTFLFLLLSIFSCDKRISNQASQPNIILILVDDLGKEWISCYGADNIETPNIDALAESGILFNSVYAMPQCTPTRTTILTGQYPFRHGWINHWDVPRWGGGAHFDETLNPSIGIEMKQAGYKTCIAGKWQIDDFRVEPDALTKNGFDEYCMWTGYESGISASSKRYQQPYIYTSNGSKTYENRFGPDIFKDFIIDFIHTNKEAPMFIYYPMVLTHTPLVNTPDEIAETDLGKHKAMVNYTDKITGEIIKALEDAKIRENTIVIWTTDNGTTRKIEGSLNGHKVKGGKATTTETGICLPFIASWPDKIKPH